MTNTIEELEQITDTDLEELASQIQKGYTSGRLDSEIDNDKQKHISWELKVNIWTD